MMSPASQKLYTSSAFTCSWTWFHLELLSKFKFILPWLFEQFRVQFPFETPQLSPLIWQLLSKWPGPALNNYRETEMYEKFNYKTDFSRSTVRIPILRTCFLVPEYLVWPMVNPNHIKWCTYPLITSSASYFTAMKNSLLLSFSLASMSWLKSTWQIHVKKSPDSLQNEIIKCFMSLIDGCDDKKDLFSICAFAKNVTIPYSRTLFITRNKFRII